MAEGKLETRSVDLNIDEGTFLIVAEVIRHERGAAERDYQEACDLVFACVKRLAKGRGT